MLILLFSSFAMFAQNITVTGTIIDNTFKEPVIGATVVVEGDASHGTATDIDGNFTLTNVDPNANLIVSYVGMKSQTIAVNGRTQIDITLSDDTEMLEEVVVTGYGGRQSRTTLTNSISKLDNKVLKNSAMSNAGQSLQGTIAGLRVVNTSGRPGAEPNIVLRGGATISGSNNQALVVVDGVVRSLNDINPSDIESVEVLKDAASTAIYGARANGGVILVTTKRGKEGTTNVNYTFKGGLNYARTGYDFLNAEDYIYYNRLGNKRINDAGFSRTITQVDNSSGYGATNSMFSVKYLTDETRPLLQQGWQQMKDPYSGRDLIFQDFSGEMKNIAFKSVAYTQDHYVSAAGGNDLSTFQASLGYYDEQGQVIGTGYKRFTGNLNASYKIRPNFTLQGGTTYSQSSNPTLWIGEAQMFYRSMSLWPTWNPWDAEGNPTSGTGSSDGNPLYWKEKLVRNGTTKRATWNIGFNWEILPKKLYLRENSTIYSIDILNENFNKKYQTQNSTIANETRVASAKDEKVSQQQHSLIMEYNESFNNLHNLNAMVGSEWFDYKDFIFEAETRNSPSDDIPTMNVGSERSKTLSVWDGYRILSYFGRVNYNYNYRYLLSLVARYDGISRLSNNRWGFFPGISAGWNLHQEEFYQDSKLSSYISTIKPRISYGINGNVSGLSNFEVYGLYEPLLQSDNRTPLQYDKKTGFLNTKLANGNLRWEQSKSLEVGVDLGLFDNKISIITGYYNRQTDDLLTELALPGYLGFSSIRTNLGSLQNTGFEIEARANIFSNTDGFSWDISANLATVSNKIIRLPYNGNENNRQGGHEIYDPASKQYIWEGGIQEGKSIGDIYAFKQERIYKDWDDVKTSAGDRYDAIGELYGPNKWATMNAAERVGKKPIEPGDVHWADLDGNGVINSYDRVKIGNVFPNITGGFSTTFSWKGLSLSGRFEYALGHTIYNDLRARSLGQYQGTFNLITDVKNMWSEDNTDASLPKFYYADQLGKLNITRSNKAGINIHNNNSAFYEKGDYLALRELTLSYLFPRQLISKLGLSNATMSLTGQNLAYFTKYSGTSPEPSALNHNNANVRGVDEGRYPLPKTVLLGLSLSF